MVYNSYLIRIYWCGYNCYSLGLILWKGSNCVSNYSPSKPLFVFWTIFELKVLYERVQHQLGHFQSQVNLNPTYGSISCIGRLNWNSLMQDINMWNAWSCDFPSLQVVLRSNKHNYNENMGADNVKLILVKTIQRHLLL